jgi:hypothetical protein
MSGIPFDQVVGSDLEPRAAIRQLTPAYCISQVVHTFAEQWETYVKRQWVTTLCSSILLSSLLVVGDASGSTALAATRTRGDACGPGACGSATFSFEDNKHVISDASLSVKDTRFDGNSVYVQLRVHDASGIRDVLHLDNAGGAGETNVEDGQRYESRTIINGVQVMVCVDDWGRDTCYFSRFIDNPES